MEVLHFTILNAHVCLELQSVYKLLQLPELKPVPGASDDLAGMLNLAGISVPVYDFGIHLGLQRNEEYSLHTPLIICKNKNNQFIGLLVDKIYGLSSLDEQSFQTYDNIAADESPFSAMVTIEDEVALLINLSYLFKMSWIEAAPRYVLNNETLTQVAIKHE